MQDIEVEIQADLDVSTLWQMANSESIAAGFP
jgi:hypothetical protein